MPAQPSRVRPPPWPTRPGTPAAPLHPHTVAQHGKATSCILAQHSVRHAQQIRSTAHASIVSELLNHLGQADTWSTRSKAVSRSRIRQSVAS